MTVNSIWGIHSMQRVWWLRSQRDQLQLLYTLRELMGVQLPDRYLKTGNTMQKKAILAILKYRI